MRKKKLFYMYGSAFGLYCMYKLAEITLKENAR